MFHLGQRNHGQNDGRQFQLVRYESHHVFWCVLDLGRKVTQIAQAAGSKATPSRLAPPLLLSTNSSAGVRVK